MQQFDAIRPYRDDEVRDAIKCLVDDPEFLLLVGRFRAPRLTHWAPGPVRLWLKWWLRRLVGDVASIDQLQRKLYDFVDAMVRSTTRKVTTSGLENLEKGRAYLFVSNHRDIVFDPMVVNYLLFRKGFETTRIAIGDNLLKNHFFGELMRLNKSFVVHRNIASPRDMRNAYLTLSSFISHSIEERHSIWIAQREGRAKNGVDRTDPAIIKMFFMSQKKAGRGFSEAMNRLNIVPVSISYEYDPCDAVKARELEIRARTGSYQKGPDEDTDQIVRGITGYKGRVHVHFGRPVTEAPDNAVAMAEAIDRDIAENYHLHASNLAAYGMLRHQARAEPGTSHAATEALEDLERQAAQNALGERLAQCDPVLRPYVLEMYANPVIQSMAAKAAVTDLAD